MIPTITKSVTIIPTIHACTNATIWAITQRITDPVRYPAQVAIIAITKIIIPTHKFFFISYRFYTTKQLKEMFGLSKDDYCKKDGKFNRTEFEKKTIEVAIKEINQNTRMKVEYKKNKIKNRVANYQFNFIEIL